jgi:hypothetical protein
MSSDNADGWRDDNAPSWREDDPVVSARVIPSRSGHAWTIEVVTSDGAYVLPDLCLRTAEDFCRDLTEAEANGHSLVSVMVRWIQERDDELSAYERGELPDGTKFDEL